MSSSTLASASQWQLREAGTIAINRALDHSKRLGIHPLIAHLAYLRGYEDPETMRPFLDPSLRELPDPCLLLDCDQAAKRILEAFERHERVVIYGDYDVDGVTSSALLWRFFKEALQLELSVYIPQRLTEGYGLNKDAIRALSARGTQVIITVDNGSAAIEEVALAQSLGMDVIIVDHHTVSVPEPPAFAHLNPHRPECRYPDQNLAAVGVAFMLIIHIRRLLRDDARFPHAQSPNLSELLDIVALGTVADVAPLVGINRILVRAGLKVAQEGKRIGLWALAELSDVKLNQLTARDIGFKLGPRLNAAGRINDARAGLQLLITDQREEARHIASQVDHFNRERRSIQEDVQREAMLQAEQHQQRSVIVVSSPRWHHGVVGIVAARISDRFNRPAIVLGGDQVNGQLVLKGSARSVPHINLKAALDHCSEYLLTYGGHAAAAGLTLNPSNLQTFINTLDQTIKEGQSELHSNSPIIADAELALHEVNPELLEQLSLLEPLGHGNPAPLFITRGVKARAKTLSQGKHLKLHFNLPPPLPAEAIGWGLGSEINLCNGPIDLVYQPRWDEYQGIKKIILFLSAVRRHDPSPLPPPSMEA